MAFLLFITQAAKQRVAAVHLRFMWAACEGTENAENWWARLGSNQRPADYEARSQASQGASASRRRTHSRELGSPFVSERLHEYHEADVKTDVKTEAPTVARAGADPRGKISQEFTWCLTACQATSWRLRACQAVSRTASRRSFDGLPASKPGDTVHRMVLGLREVQEVEADAGESRWSARPEAAWHGTRITVPSIAFATVSAGAACGYPSKLERPR
jgi:hypothetical protein